MTASTPTLHVGERPVCIEDVERVAVKRGRVLLIDRGPFVARIARGAAIVERRLAHDVPTYGVNTGFGASVRNSVSAEYAHALARNLPRYHGCGVGPMLSEAESRALMLVRLVSLATGFSGVRPELLQRMCALLEAGLSPVIPSRGSVGASGDLTPLSYVVALLVGERGCLARWTDRRCGAGAAERGLRALVHRPQGEPGDHERHVADGGARLPRLQARRALCARRCAADRAAGGGDARPERALRRAAVHGQGAPGPGCRRRRGSARISACRSTRAHADRASRSATPSAVHHTCSGPLVDALSFCRGVLEIEINGASDNPLVDPETGDVLHGGNFYGGHLAMVADLLKTQVANLADLFERQLVLLNNPAENGGLPENLVLVEGPARASHHGFKAMEITASALTAEALKLTMPASVFSRSTESHNQDKVSMGTLAMHDLARVLELVETVQAIQLIACCQALDCRARLTGFPPLPARQAAVLGLVRSQIAPTLEDRPMDADIESALDLMHGDALWALLEEGP